MESLVSANQKLSSQYYRLSLRAAAISRRARPGQFVMLQVNRDYDPLLRRPFALHSWDDKGNFQILYRLVGRGTALMTQLQPGDVIDVLGPLGNGFHLREPDRGAILAAGAIGVAPLLPWARQLLEQQRIPPAKIKVLIGGRSRSDILCLPEFRALGIQSLPSTEDGSLGRTGLLTAVLEEVLSQNPAPVFACGPAGMLRAVSLLGARYNVSCQISMEALMACGVGACQGCVIKTRKGGGFAYQRVCKEGPVFESKDILWE